VERIGYAEHPGMAARREPTWDRDPPAVAGAGIRPEVNWTSRGTRSTLPREPWRLRRRLARAQPEAAVDGSGSGRWRGSSA